MSPSGARGGNGALVVRPIIRGGGEITDLPQNSVSHLIRSKRQDQFDGKRAHESNHIVLVAAMVLIQTNWQEPHRLPPPHGAAPASVSLAAVVTLALAKQR